MKNKRTLLSILAFLLIITGAAIALFPDIMKWWDTKITMRQYISFAEEIQNTDDKNTNTFDIPANHSNLDLERLYRDILQYNKNLYKNGQGILSVDIFAQSSFNLEEYGIPDGIIGYIKADSINMLLPIFLGSSTGNMYKGATNMKQTSVPIGGANTNSVLAGHTGMIHKVMFDNLTQIKNDDIIIIQNYWDELKYKVTSKKIIMPYEFADIIIQKDRDLLTLITCYPYGYSDKRYVVICERI